ncbi:adenylyltransferase/cytidyltransferase family protein [Patescibacteria group bacterium]|nr:adenylyltransferase/cytidyltransferase family protein [Patescibacteria group bacterium]
MKKVLVFGTFDVVHQGHLNFFDQAKKLGDLNIVIARDVNVKKVKGQTPHHSEKIRKAQIVKLKIADKVYLGNLANPYKIISKIKPDIIALGYDQTSFTKDLPVELKNRKLKIKIVRLKPFKPDQYKSSKIKKAGRT